ncbi:alpha/beta fold hydrolase [Tsukamurella sp. 8F]|uniref:alpha/beta fold hydrolase n=1 Tax=unclassified Tsukamurella TaxID=2633480 RepID=UPI0023B9594C|nr:MULTISPECIES: alpha/beta fold hydrolase [unclassified Tsukamurella]MDF0528526.1 alpha/beta fold hydrolase [Tsukamurella sp. 8J]MDF0586352.1 alpha/beta fold hydrolase [Tsukamurella sp. 8F]
MTIPDQTRFDVATSDGLTLAGFRYGTNDPDLPTVLAVHGYPDNHHVWDGVAARLAGRANVVTFDVRGAGESEAPAGKAGYRFPQIIDDIARVIDAIGVDRVHLLGHDWGSIQAWHAVCEPEVAARVASYTSISGPNLNHGGRMFRSVRDVPGALSAAQQLVSSAYIPVFLTPGVAETLYRRGWGQKLIERLERRGAGPVADGVYLRSDRDFVNGLNLYRANMPRPFLRPEPATTTVPVQVLTPRGDLFVRRATQLGGLDASPRSRDREISGGHWVVTQRPEAVVEPLLEWVGENR